MELANRSTQLRVALQPAFHLAARVQNRCVVAIAEVGADLLKRERRQSAREIHAHMSRHNKAPAPAMRPNIFGSDLKMTSNRLHDLLERRFFRFGLLLEVVQEHIRLQRARLESIQQLELVDGAFNRPKPAAMVYHEIDHVFRWRKARRTEMLFKHQPTARRLRQRNGDYESSR